MKKEIKFTLIQKREGNKKPEQYYNETYAK
jgi:hypothetical protein